MHRNSCLTGGGGFGAKGNIRPAGGRVRAGKRTKEGDTGEAGRRKRRVERKEEQQLVDRREQDESRTGGKKGLAGCRRNGRKDRIPGRRVPGGHVDMQV